ncbi:cytochrome b [Candidatus Albibeggiatoa sp. nov. NOAA]|uniref:cytochrome b n=1 Tax=Candidatus Albibeggiatoa sp. nov. NOAA TaxID=3162724 RepID=UPI0032F8C2E6|nr:cytochrome b [Thiotrichaceae bacterium]
MLKNTQEHWGLVSKAFHWLTALIIISLFGLGLWMVELSYYDPWYRKAPDLHKSLGIIVISLMLLRLIWRVINPTPKSLATHQTWERYLAHTVHIILYLLVFSIGITGYLISTADGRAIEVFNIISIPSLGMFIERQEDIAGWVHWVLAWTLITFVGLHLIGALKHHFIDKDATLVRMLHK